MRAWFFKLAWMLLFTGEALAATARYGQHPKFDRIALDMSKQNVTVETSPDTLSIRLVQAYTGDLGNPARSLQNSLKGGKISPDGKLIVFNLNAPKDSKYFWSNKTLVIDLYPKNSKKTVSAPYPEEDIQPPDPNVDPTPELKETQLAISPKTIPAPSIPQPIGVGIMQASSADKDNLIFIFPQKMTLDIKQIGKSLNIDSQATIRLEPSNWTQILPEWLKVIEHQETPFRLHIGTERSMSHTWQGNNLMLSFAKPLAVSPPVEPLKLQETPKLTLPKVPDPNDPIQISAPPVTPKPETVKVEQVQPIVDAEKPSITNRLNLQVSFTPTSISLAFPWEEETASSVFKRAGHLWLVFNRNATIDMSNLRQEGNTLVSDAAQFPLSMGTIIRLRVKSGYEASVWRRGNTWNIDLRQQDIRPEQVVRIIPEPQAIPSPRLILEMNGMVSPMRVEDPDLGDTLWIVPAITASHGNAQQRQFNDIFFLSSSQGLALSTQSEDVMLEQLNPTQIAVKSDAGLKFSDLPADIQDAALGVSEGRLFNFSVWQQGKPEQFYSMKQELQRKVAESPKSRRGQTRLVLAQFLMSHGYITEAAGAIGVMIADDETLGREAMVIAMQGAAAFLMGKHAEAALYLNNPKLDNMPEIPIWRAANVGALKQYDTALALLKTMGNMPPWYPARMAVDLVMPVAETYIERGDPAASLTWLDDLSILNTTVTQKNKIAWLQARIMLKTGKEFSGEKLLKNLENSSDQWVRSRAKYTLILHGLDTGSYTPKDAIKILERLRFAWRGDTFELEMLAKLADLYANQKDWRGAMRTRAQIMKRFAGNPLSQKVDTAMRDDFKKLFLDGEADALPPLAALALFDEFRALTPDGDEGDSMIRKLADRLVAVDLLDRAGELLLHQVKERLEGVERARVGAQLALVHLLDSDGGSAIQALELSSEANIPEPLNAQRRLLKARALLMKKELDEALITLTGDNSSEADSIRTEVYWQKSDYPQVIAVLKRLVPETPPAPPIPDQTFRHVLALSLALSLDQRYNDVEILQKSWDAVLQKTSYYEAFTLVARPPEDAQVSNFDDIAKRFADIRQLSDFLENYKIKLKSSKLSSVN
jgi:hypothetical protein